MYKSQLCVLCPKRKIAMDLVFIMKEFSVNNMFMIDAHQKKNPSILRKKRHFKPTETSKCQSIV